MDRITELRTRMAATKREADALLAAVADRDGQITAEERERYDRMVADLDAWGATLDRLLDMQQREIDAAARAERDRPPAETPENRAGDAAPQNAATPPVEQRDVLEPYRFGDHEFRNFGDFVGACVEGDPRVRAYQAHLRDLSMGVGAEGGILIPEQWRQAIMQIDGEAELVRPRATRIPATTPPDAKLSFPTLKQGAVGVMGGLAFEWVGEGGDKPETDFDLEGISTEPKEFAAYTTITDKLLRNSQVMATYLRVMLNRGVSHDLDLSLIKGNGVGKPLGAWNSPGAIKVNRAAAGAFGFTDVVNMLAALLPESWTRALWALHQTLLPSAINLADAAGNSIFVAGDATKGISPTLLGVPIRWTGKTYALGTTGDAALMDFSYYLYREGAGPFIAMSEHVYFLQNKSVVKCFGSVDGQGWVKTPLTLDDGVTQVSPFVLLNQ